MKKSVVFIGGILLAISGMLAYISPDKLSLAVVSIMGVIVMLGFVFGIIPLLQYIGAFKQGTENLEGLKKINSDNLWVPLARIEPFFGQKKIDDMFSEYIEKADEQREQGVVISDIENVINDDSISVRSWRGVVLQIAGTLTALGLLGTFLGLATGISGVKYGSLEDTVAGVETMLRGITTAFYTSIAGVILSIIFNAVYRIVWNMTLRQLQLFIERFHIIVHPEANEFITAKQYLNSEQMVGYLSRMYDMGAKLLNMTNGTESQEQRIMLEVLTSVRKNEFTFSLEPVCRLSDRSIIEAAVNLRWEHDQLGVISPERYMAVVEMNGYIVKLACTMWEQACEAQKSWYEKGLNPVPLIFKISKTEILSMDIASHMAQLIEKHGLAPRDLELAVDAMAYLVCSDEAKELEGQLIQKGFKVSIYGFNGDFLGFPESRADEVRLDLNALESDENIPDVFDHAASRRINLTACEIDSAKQLALVRKAGCEYGQGKHLYEELTLSAYEKLMKYS